jgi:hypothetical protein
MMLTFSSSNQFVNKISTSIYCTTAEAYVVHEEVNIFLRQKVLLTVIGSCFIIFRLMLSSQFAFHQPTAASEDNLFVRHSQTHATYVLGHPCSKELQQHTHSYK